MTTAIPSARGSDHGVADAGNADTGNTGRDPVCGMMVDPATAKHRAEHAGHDYFFCSAGCRDRFIAEPARYLAPAPAATQNASFRLHT